MGGTLLLNWVNLTVTILVFRKWSANVVSGDVERLVISEWEEDSFADDGRMV